MPETTYGRLDKTLRSLGFTLRVLEDRTHVYRHDATGALVIIPEFPADDVVTPHHLVAARSILEAYGIAEPWDFAAQLQRAS